MNSSAAEEYFGSFSPQNFMGYINSFNLSDEYKRMLWKKWNSIQKSPDYEIIERISLVVFIFVVTIGVIGNCTIIFIQISKSFLILNNTDLGVYIFQSGLFIEFFIYCTKQNIQPIHCNKLNKVQKNQRFQILVSHTTKHS